MCHKTLKAAAAEHADLIPPPYNAIYEAGGYEGLAAVLGLLGGGYVYVPTLRSVLARCIEAGARREMAASHATLGSVARKYGYSSRHFRRLVGG